MDKNEVISLDERIRAKACADLRAEIEDAARPLDDKMRLGYRIEIPGMRLKDVNHDISIHEALHAIKLALIEELQPKREQDAIDKFLARVEELSSEVKELRASQ